MLLLSNDLRREIGAPTSQRWRCPGRQDNIRPQSADGLVPRAGIEPAAVRLRDSKRVPHQPYTTVGNSKLTDSSGFLCLPLRQTIAESGRLLCQNREGRKQTSLEDSETSSSYADQICAKDEARSGALYVSFQNS